MSDLLIAIAIDFDGSGKVAAHARRIAESLKQGKAGDVCWAVESDAVLFTRSRTPTPSPRIRSLRIHRDDDGGVTLLAGRLFERETLLAILGRPGSRENDASLYAAAHARFGSDCDLRITGDYAAIRWFPASRRLRIARSPMSRHPIHLWRDGPQLVAASIPRALFAAGVSDALDQEALDDYLMLSGPPPRRSLYRACSRVPAGHVLEANPEGQRLRQYWSIGDVPPVRFRCDDDYVEAADEQMRRALSAELADARKPAVSLSGGLDSQAVAAYALDSLPSDARITTFTSVPMAGWQPAPRPSRFGDEGDHVRALAEMHPRIDAHFVTADNATFGEGLDGRMLLSSWPSFNELNAHWALAIGRAAAEEGCEILLSGDFGNFSFSYDGHTGFADWFARGKWGRLAREVARSGDSRSFARALISRGIWPHVPNRLRLWRDQNNPWNVSPFASWCPLREDYAATARIMERARSRQVNIDGYAPASSRQLRAEMWSWVVGGAPEIALGQTLSHGVELADPTAFVPLVELCAGIPDEQYLRDGTDRWLARRMLEGKVPDMVRLERRTGAQSADWPLRIRRERTALLAELGQIGRDPRLSAVFDVERMQNDLATWDGTDDADARNFFRVAICVTRGVSTARFVRYAEGRNVG